MVALRNERQPRWVFFQPRALLASGKLWLIPTANYPWCYRRAEDSCAGFSYYGAERALARLVLDSGALECC
jgi:hypothetical protein